MVFAIIENRNFAILKDHILKVSKQLEPVIVVYHS